MAAGIPVLHLPSLGTSLRRGSPPWNTLRDQVRAACETHGCFELLLSDNSRRLCAAAFSAMKPLFHLPAAAKSRNTHPKPYHSYGRVGPYEGFGIPDASNPLSLRDFSRLVCLPPQEDDHHPFCETVGAMVKQVEAAIGVLEGMILDSYGLEEERISECRYLLRAMKYSPDENSPVQLYAHTDKPLLSLLCEDQVSGLEVMPKEGGDWIRVSPSSPYSLIFLVGDPLMAWSNGRLHAVKHRVVLKDEKERFSFGVFAVPMEGEKIRVPDKLVDDDHPRAFKDFDFTDYLFFSYSEEAKKIDSAMQIHTYAGV